MFLNTCPAPEVIGNPCTYYIVLFIDLPQYPSSCFPLCLIFDTILYFSRYFYFSSFSASVYILHLYKMIGLSMNLHFICSLLFFPLHSCLDPKKMCSKNNKTFLLCMCLYFNLLPCHTVICNLMLLGIFMHKNGCRGNKEMSKYFSCNIF